MCVMHVYLYCNCLRTRNGRTENQWLLSMCPSEGRIKMPKQPQITEWVDQYKAKI